MQLRVVYPDGKFGQFDLLDEATGEKVGYLFADSFVCDHQPKVEAMTRFQNAKLVLDGKSLKRLQRDVRKES